MPALLAQVLNKLTQMLSLFIILAAIFFALIYTIIPISVNSGRITHLQREEAQIQSVVSQIARDPTAPGVKESQAVLIDLNSKRESLIGEIEWGAYQHWHLSFAECLVSIQADCFHKNASETNILYLAMASGVIGSCLFLLLGIYTQTLPQSQPGYHLVSLPAVVSFIPIGLLVAMATLFAVRGTKGALLAPISDVVQLENPYGIAFVTSFAAFASLRVLSIASGLIDWLPNLWKSGSPANPKPATAQVADG
jgi:hypothetical protein